MTQKSITSRVIKTELVNWKQLTFIQEEDFKEWINDGDKKLLDSLLKFQFIDPFKVWEHDGKQYCLDGKHRYLDLESIEKMGIDVPELLPATFIDCEDYNDAAKLVLIFSSAYATIKPTGLTNFIDKHFLNLPELNNFILLPDFDMVAFSQLHNPLDLEPFVREQKDKPASMRITFANPEQLNLALPGIKSLLDSYIGSFYSLSAGEI